MNTGRGVSIQPGDHAPSWLEIPGQGMPSQTQLLINILRNSSGQSNQPQFDPAGVHSLSLEMPTFDSSTSSCPSSNEGDQVKVPASVSEVSSTNNQSRDMLKIGSNSMNLCTDDDDEFSWSHMMSLMSASSSFPVNGMNNGSMSEKPYMMSASHPNDQSSSNLVPQTPTKGSIEQGESQMTSSSSGANLMSVSHSHASDNLKQCTTEPPQPATHYHGQGHEKSSLYYQKENSRIQLNTTCSTPPLQTFYPASNDTYGPTPCPPDGFPVPYQAQTHCTQNYVRVHFTPGIANSSKFAPPTPNQANNLGTQQCITPTLTVDHDHRVQAPLSMTSYHPFAPYNPPLANNLDQHLQDSAEMYLPPNKSKNQAQIQVQALAVPTVKDTVEHVCQDTTGNIMDCPTASGTPQEGGDTLEIEDGQSIDLNKTPPQKTPRRRKHRPKVIREKKPPKTRKPSAPKIGPDGTKVAKRKYVRKNKANGIDNPLSNIEEDGEASKMEPTSKSCKRTLSFDLESGGLDQIQKTADTNCHTVLKSMSSPNKLEEVGQEILQSASQMQQQVSAYKQPSEDATCHSLTGQKSGGAPSTSSISSQLCQKKNQNEKKVDDGDHTNIRGKKPPKNRKPSAPKIGPDGTKVAKRKYVRTIKPNGIDNPLSRTEEGGEASNMDTTPKSCRRTLTFDLENDGLDQMQKTSDTNCHTVLRSMSSPEKLEEVGQQILQGVSQMQQQVFAYKQPSEYATCHSITGQKSGGTPSTSSISSLLLCQENFQNKRKKVDNGYHTNIRGTQYSSIHGEGANQIQRIGHMLNHFTHGELLNSFHNIDTSKAPVTKLSSSTNEWQSYSGYYYANAQRQQMSSGLVAKPGYHSKSEEHLPNSYPTLSSLHGRTGSKIQAQNPFIEALSAERIGKWTGNRTECSPMLVKHRAITAPIIPSQSTGQCKEQMNLVSVEDIVELLGCLDLNGTNNETVQNDLSAIVPYKADGSIVPYEKFEALKRRKDRPKVDLDPETNRLWNVLMGKVITEDENKTDEEKAKWWEEERKVFHGRADSFIARMHLVQGDRRFSPWKGSVVDSVIGVFLTQNVTDHLSSSAFISLAARFPCQSTRNGGTGPSDGLSVITQEPEVCVLESNGETPRYKELNQEIYARNQDRHDPSSCSGIQYLDDGKNWRLEEVISSQDSAESSNLQAIGGIQSFMESTSKDYHVNDGKFDSKHCPTLFNFEGVNDTERLPDNTIQVTGNSFYEASTKGSLQYQNTMGPSEKKQTDELNINSTLGTSHNLLDLNYSYWRRPTISSSNNQCTLAGSSKSCSAEILGMQNLMYMNSSASGVTLIEDTDTTREQIGQELNSETVLLQNRSVKAYHPPTHSPCAFPCMQSLEMRNIMQASINSYHQICDEDQYKDKNLSFHSSIVNEPLHKEVKMSQTSVICHDSQGQTTHVDQSILMVENRMDKQHRAEAENLNKQVCSSTEESSKIKKNELKSRSGGPASKRVTFDWDSLRKQAQASNNQRERSKETADSMNYEALRHADMADISKAIKERGMNNMLAERMKDFLNRIAHDHGSVDLEWLRDVPPEKAKDYLLSIRGLGLKSVECIRLLTLHQHAFPVDTNVGRIAVRLGWVPLQPLPESLQLHLLELYPVLESIQKYLWPRLCNLDQRTLYELHYQLITFGKVFCTKSRPNCNACPMRGECRHFASAFASSMLTLPGPEDKSIVTVDVPIKATEIPSIAVNPIPLQSLEGVPYHVVKTDQRCEPIVEEPSTPEPEITETEETDIEDFFEDTDDIPTIRLNVEEFAANLQNFMQGNMENLEDDMSKALVALDPEAASIPTPKLKNVSRLRTEHQVYQLPDSHPLLKELEVRESDDPSPYLLAIWTPGETENSIQPPEGRCSSQESGRLCSENTCFTCNSIREGNAQTVRGTLLIPCRTAMRGSFPLNGTYFQVNEVFADHESSLNPVSVPRSWIWNLPRRTVYFGTSVTSIFKGMSTENIQYCFWRGFVCVRGFDRQSRAPRPLRARLHYAASSKRGGKPKKGETKNNSGGQPKKGETKNNSTI